jgi:hypothetical protein
MLALPSYLLTGAAFGRVKHGWPGDQATVARPFSSEPLASGRFLWPWTDSVHGQGITPSPSRRATRPRCGVLRPHWCPPLSERARGCGYRTDTPYPGLRQEGSRQGLGRHRLASDPDGLCPAEPGGEKAGPATLPLSPPCRAFPQTDVAGAKPICPTESPVNRFSIGIYEHSEFPRPGGRLASRCATLSNRDSLPRFAL